MSGKHHRSAGTDFQILNINGQEYKIRPLTVGMFAEMESYIVSQRRDPFSVAAEFCKSNPKELHQSIWDAAMRNAVNSRTVSIDEISAFENSIRGIAWKLWKCAERDNPDINSVEKAMALMTKAGPGRQDEIAKLIQVASGEADLGNSCGREPPAKVEEVAAAPAGQ